MLCENPVPREFTRGTVSAKEARLRAAIETVDAVHIIARSGAAVERPDKTKGELEQKIYVHLLPPCPYYLSPVLLFIWGFYYVVKIWPVSIEAESPILSGVAAVLLGKLFSIPSIVELRASYEELLEYRLTWIPMFLKRLVLRTTQRAVFRHAHGVIANSTYYQNMLNRDGIASTIINPGIQGAPNVIAHEHHQGMVFGYLGRLAPEKGVAILMRAYAAVAREVPHVSLLIAGDGPERAALEALARELSLESRVDFLGWQDAFEFLSSIDVLVNPNTVRHPLEMVNVEAAYMGVPVITFGEAGLPETVVHRHTGLVVSESDSPAVHLARSMRAMLQTRTRHAMSTASPAFARKNYDFAIMVQRLQRLYLDLGVIGGF